MENDTGVPVLRRQTELSLALAALFFSGGLFALLVATVLPPVHPYPWQVIAGIAAIGFVVMGIVLWRGRRLTELGAAMASVFYLASLVVIVLMSTTLVRSMVTAMLSVVVIVLITWFFPIWVSRWVGYTSLTVIGVALIVKYQSNEAILAATAVFALAVLLTEVFGRLKRTLERSSLTDHLCGVWNRRGFDLALDREVRIVARTGEPLTMVYIDLDGFKTVNDTLGHIEGDQVLRTFSRSIVRDVRSGDSVARIGGDEFVVLLPRTSAEQAALLCQRLSERVTVCPWSYGIAEYRSGESAREFVDRSDRELLAHKRSRGRRSLHTAD